jgi:hypothetical protein
MENKLAIFILFLTFIGFNTIFADEWGWPTEKDYFSENGKFVAHVTPPKYLKKVKSLVEVFEIKDKQRVPLWQCFLGNEVAPVEVYISNDGKYVLTCNEWHKVGYGNLVVAFYSKDGRIKSYSMEEILHLPKDISRIELSRLVPHSTASRRWDENSIKFFDTYADKLYFCVWLDLFDRWIAWNPANGEEVIVNDEMVKSWNNKARLWSLREIEKKFHSDAPYKFLGKLKNPEDRHLIEKLLSDEKFSIEGSRSRTVRPSSAGSHPIYHLERYYSSSSNRLLAEQILANWDGRPAYQRTSSKQPLYYLGKVKGMVLLPKTDTPKEAALWLYLVPTSIPQEQWHKKPPVQHLVKNFTDYGFRNFDLEFMAKFPFAIAAVTPGQYRIKAILDKTKPLSKRTDSIYVPQPGDYQSLGSTVITIEAGKTIDNIIIDCTHEVIGGTD